MPTIVPRKKVQRETLTIRGNLAAFRNQDILPKIASKPPILPFREDTKVKKLVNKRKKI